MIRSLVGGSPERPFGHLAEHLIALRKAARLSQRALAEIACVSRGSVQNAETGAAAPSVEVLDVLVRGCGGGPVDLARARLLRSRGRRAQRGRLRGLNAPAPALIRTEDDLGAALVAAYEEAGAPSLSDARLTPGRRPLPRTTAWRIVQRKALPASVEQLVTFLTACGVAPAELRLYVDAYDRVIAARGVRPAPPRARRPVSRFVRHRVPLSQGGSADDRYEFTDAAAAAAERVPVTVLEEALAATVGRWVEREARRNGAAAPDLVAATSLLDFGVDLVTRSPDGRRTTVYQVKSSRRPGPPGPGALGVPASPLPSAPPDRAA